MPSGSTVHRSTPCSSRYAACTPTPVATLFAARDGEIPFPAPGVESLPLPRLGAEDAARLAAAAAALPSDVIDRISAESGGKTLTGPLDWNATLIEGEVVRAVPALKEKHTGNLIVSGCGELAHTLAQQGLADEFWFWVNPHLWPAGPRILDGVGPLRLQLVAATTYRSGVIWLRYRPAGA
jgi:riboflavin biosynthesis pyrimidine reductase